MFAGAIPMVKPELTGDFATLMEWADAVRRMKVRANAETPLDARTARGFGAEGIGLCRTEHMFFEGERIVAVREMILADDEAGRRAALAKLLPMQRKDFAELFEIMHGPAGDDPPARPAAARVPAADRGRHGRGRRSRPAPRSRSCASARHELHEFNPMLGFRGVRLAVRYPEIAEMQARAIFEGAVEAGRKTGAPVTAEIMVPLVMGRPELDLVKKIIVEMAETVAKETGVKVPYQVGTMIELPRAALRAGEIAESAEFFSFGTNDLTQTTLGLSRDDAAAFLGAYTSKGLLRARSVRDARPGRRRRTGQDRGRARARRRARTSSSASAASTAAIPPASPSARRCTRLRLLLAVPRADRAAGGGAGGAWAVGRGADGVAAKATAARGAAKVSFAAFAVAGRAGRRGNEGVFGLAYELKRRRRACGGRATKFWRSCSTWFGARLLIPDRFGRTQSKGF